MTTENTAVEMLRRAAALMRERATKAPPGPWFVTDGAARYGGLVAAPTDVFPEDDGYAGHLIGESMSPANREYVASMHPPVALAVADWLDGVAEAQSFADQRRAMYVDSALAVARAYLRVESEVPV